MFGFAAFVVAVRRPGVLARRGGARRAMTGEDPPRALVLARARATAGATAATSSTSGWRVLFIGVAASSAFQHAHDVALDAGPDGAGRRLRRHATCADGAIGDAARRQPREDRPRRRRCDVSQGRQARRRRCGREARLLPGAGRRRSARSARFFEGEATSEVGLQAGPAPRRLDRDRRRTSATMRPIIDEGDKVFGATDGKLAAGRAGAAPRPGARPGSSSATRTEPPPATFRLISLAAGDVDLDRRPDRLRRRPDRAVAGAATPRRAASAAATPRASRRSSAARSVASGDRACGRARPADRHRRAGRRGRGWSARRCAAARPRRVRGARRAAPRGARGRARRPSTARSATPSSTTAPASSPRPTGARSTASCAPRRSRSCARLDELPPGPTEVGAQG